MGTTWETGLERDGWPAINVVQIDFRTFVVVPFKCGKSSTPTSLDRARSRLIYAICVLSRKGGSETHQTCNVMDRYCAVMTLSFSAKSNNDIGHYILGGRVILTDNSAHDFDRLRIFPYIQGIFRILRTNFTTFTIWNSNAMQIHSKI